MNVLDENIPKSQAVLLESWRIHFRQIGVNVGRSGMSDEDIIPLLLRKPATTFFTRDRGFYDPKLCHRLYCLVVLAVDRQEAASFIRRFLRHPEFITQSKRMGRVVRVSRARISVRAVSERREKTVKWFAVA